MAVEVQATRDLRKKDKYRNGASIGVTEGNLIVRHQSTTGGNGKIIAVYAPNEWITGVVTDDTEGSE
jgi:hypothetical protein